MKVKKSEGRHAIIPLDKLCFDPENPRLPKGMRASDERDVLQWMLINGNLPALMESISSSGYSDAEPLLVIPEEDMYVVVEGNRRLAALKLLLNPDLAPLRKKTIAEIAETAKHKNIINIPVICYENRRDIVDYLGFRHITGVKAWSPREKADYLKQLYQIYKNESKSQEETIAIISKIVGTKPYYAKRLLDTLTVVEWAEENAFWGNEIVAQNLDSSFSVIHTALSYGGIRKYIGLEDFTDGNTEKLKSEAAERLFDWICGNKKINDSRDLKNLNSAISNSTSLGMLEKGYSLVEALEYSGEAINDFRTFLQIATAKLSEADRLSSKVDRFEPSDIDYAKDLAKMAKKIFLYIKSEFGEDDEL